MLKLPKGLKKKKKGKKSKKDQELFTEEELEQYKREHQLKQVEESESEPNTSTVERKNSVEDNSFTACAKPTEQITEVKGEQDEEWSKFKALTAGVDSILHRTQDDLDRIKSTSFYQRVPTTAEKEKLERELAAVREAEKQEKERLKKLEEEANRDKLAEAVVELSDSEEESEEVDDIFNTEYIDAITSGEIQLAIVPDSPIFEVDDGPDPFDTAYADKLIKGPEVSSRGKKLVCIGSAVEVLTGRVDSAHAIALSGAKRKPRKGIQNLLLENEEDAALVFEEFPVTPEPTKTLLDDFDEDIPDIPIDLSISLHLPLLKQQEKKTDETNLENEQNQFNTKEVVLEFDVLKYDEVDEFAELAAESLTKKEEVVKVILNPQVLCSSQTVEANWAEFEQNDNKKESNNTQIKVKPPRPPPARPTTGPQIGVASQVEQNEDNFEIPEDDPFDTAFVEKVIPVNNDDDDDFDFDPRAGENQTTNNTSLIIQKDLLGGSSTNISNLGQAPLKPVQDSFEEIDPFDTSAIANIVKPKETELKFIEKELLADQNLHKSLNDPDFDPREDENLLHPQIITTEQIDCAQRKSSLSLNLQSNKSVGFLIPENDVFALDNETGKNQKPLTPYYAKAETIEEKEIEDPFDTTFVSNTKLSDIELKHIESDLLTNSNFKHSLSDPDFNPRADDNIVAQQSDLLAVEDNINIKVLTPAFENKELFTENFADPFDTSIASNIKPGKTELKLLENELLPPSISEVTTGVLDSLTDAQELGLGDKVLTPQAPILTTDCLEEVDPFDTSFASNLGPGKTEIKILENELIEN